MPRKPIDYSKTIIYKIEHIDDDSLVYVGYTTNWDKRNVSIIIVARMIRVINIVKN